MGIKLSVVRSTVQGEQIIFDILQCNPVTGEQEYLDMRSMHEAMNEALDFADLRVYEMRQRMIEGYELRKYCSGEQWAKCQDILDFMAGRQDLDLIQRRWQSQQEETAELEQLRQQASSEQYAMQRAQDIAQGCTCTDELRNAYCCIHKDGPATLHEQGVQDTVSAMVPPADRLDPLAQCTFTEKYYQWKSHAEALMELVQELRAQLEKQVRV